MTLGTFYSRANLDKFSPEEKKKSSAGYKAIIGKGDPLSFNNDAFDNLAKVRITNIDGFKETKSPNGLEIHKKLSDNTSAQAETVKETIKASLIEQQPFKDARASFKKKLSAFNELPKRTTKPINAEDLISKLKNINEDARTAIKKQQEYEITELGKLKKSPLLDNVKTSLNLDPTDDETAQNTIDSLITDLKKSHKKQLEEFDKSAQESEEKIHKFVADKMNVLNFLKCVSKDNPDMKRKIDLITEKKRKARGEPDPNTNVKFTESNTFTDVTIEDLKQTLPESPEIEFIKTLTGSPITAQKDSSYKVTFVPRFMGARYYLDPRQSPKTDMVTLANLIKAEGSKGITMTLQFENDPELAYERGRQAFEACIEAGFSPYDITIVIGSKEMKLEKIPPGKKKPKDSNLIEEELFKDHPSILNAYKEKAKTIAKELEDIKPQLNKENINGVKMLGAQMDEITKDQEEAEEKARLGQP